jgi:hypothetical protein
MPSPECSVFWPTSHAGKGIEAVRAWRGLRVAEKSKLATTIFSN